LAWWEIAATRKRPRRSAPFKVYRLAQRAA
jgi:hypothetical protein